MEAVLSAKKPVSQKRLTHRQTQPLTQPLVSLLFAGNKLPKFVINLLSPVIVHRLLPSRNEVYLDFDIPEGLLGLLPTIRFHSFVPELNVMLDVIIPTSLNSEYSSETGVAIFLATQ